MSILQGALVLIIGCAGVIAIACVAAWRSGL